MLYAIHLIQGYYISLLVSKINGYVLLAANLDDFRSIAKQIVPRKLADQIADTVAESSIKYRQERKDDSSDYDSNDETNKRQSDDDSEKDRPLYVKKEKQERPDKNTDFWSNINFEELVKKVKERLESDFKNVDSSKYNKERYNDKRLSVKSEKNSDIDEYTKGVKNNREKNLKPNKYSYEQSTDLDKYGNRNPSQHKQNSMLKRKPEATEDNIYEKIEIVSRNDSYEDYILPKKEGNIFVSAEENTQRNKHYTDYSNKHETKYKVKLTKNEDKQSDKRNNLVNVKPFIDDTKYGVQKTPTDYEYDTTDPDGKAKTENLSYDEIIQNESSHTFKHETTKRVKMGTMIPTRFRYKISTPNYYAKIPVVAEKYDFSEPLPEQDRLKENLKSIGNPPAKINAKVRL